MSTMSVCAMSIACPVPIHHARIVRADLEQLATAEDQTVRIGYARVKHFVLMRIISKKCVRL